MRQRGISDTDRVGLRQCSKHLTALYREGKGGVSYLLWCTTDRSSSSVQGETRRECSRDNGVDRLIGIGCSKGGTVGLVQVSRRKRLRCQRDRSHLVGTDVTASSTRGKPKDSSLIGMWDGDR